MLVLSRRTEYAIIAACCLARSPERMLSARQIAERCSLRLPLLMNVLKALHNAGVLLSTRGVNGGYCLADEPAGISVARVIAAVDGPAQLVRCEEPATAGPRRAFSRPRACDLLATCPIRRPMQKMQRLFERLMTDATIGTLAFDDGFELAFIEGPARLTTAGKPMKVLTT